jgi:hypothetical protein
MQAREILSQLRLAVCLLCLLISNTWAASSCICSTPCSSVDFQCFPKVNAKGAAACSDSKMHHGTWTIQRVAASMASQNAECFCPAGTVDQSLYLCPLDCKITPWGAWSICPTCGPGSRDRARTITQHPLRGGSLCPELAESHPCPHPISCPVDCEVGQWMLWSACTATCSDVLPLRTRKRPVVRANRFGGKLCPPTSARMQCPGKWVKCPSQDCIVGLWGKWGPCSGTCGTAAKKVSGLLAQFHAIQSSCYSESIKLLTAVLSLFALGS